MTPKSPTGRPSHEQRAWGELVQSKGGYWAVVCSVEEARAALEEARRGDECMPKVLE